MRDQSGSQTVQLQCQRNGENGTSVPTTSYCCVPVSHSVTYLLSQCINNRDRTSHSRMSVFDRLTPLIPQVSASSTQKQESPSVCVSAPLSLPSPIITKKPIQIPSFDERGLICEKHDQQQINTDRSFVPICSSMKSSRPSWNKSCQHSQMNHVERASTLPRAKPKTYSSSAVFENPSISIFPAPEPNSSPTPKPKPRDSLHLSASQLSDPSPLIHQPKLSVSPTLTVPTPRQSPSPTSLCQGISLDSREGKQPSPVAKERRARSITISNTKVEPECSKQRSSNEAKYDVLDQEALMDFTHPVLRRVCSMRCKESRHPTYSKSQREAATSQNYYLLQGKVGLSKKENSSKDKPIPSPRDVDISTIPKPKSNIKQQEILLSGATGTQTSLSESAGIKLANVVQKDSQSVFAGPVTQSSLNLRRKCLDYPRSKTAETATYDQSYMYSERCPSSPVTRKMSFSTEPRLNQSTVSPNIETRRRRFGFNHETKADATFLSGSNVRRPPEENNLRTSTGTSWKLSQQTSTCQNICLQAHSQTTQMDLKSAINPSNCIAKDYSCQSRDIDRTAQAPQCTHRLNQFKTCLVAPQTEEASHPASIECTMSKTISSKPAIISHKHQLDCKQLPEQSEIHKEVNLRDTGLKEADIFAPSERYRVHTELPEYPSEKCIISCPVNTDSFGISSKGVSDLPSQQHQKVHHRPDQTTTTTTATRPLHQLNASPADRAFIIEEPEDPYYVTMYYPGSVYVDMSDIVPPEVRPKPAVPAKPPNVGAPSPSTPFPPQGPGTGGGSGVSSLPPSNIPVPIGSHPPAHISSHSVGHGVGHSAGHGGGHTAAHNGGHPGSHSSGGGSTLLGYIGIDTIIEQMRKKTMKTGFDFNIMVVGHSGLGKSTLVNTLFKSQVSRRSAGWARDEKIPKTIEIKAVSHVLEEGGVKMKLTVVDTPGFGDQINNDNCWEPISKYINEQYEKFLKEEVNITRKKRIPDTRVHCCLYFISPTGHSLRQLDVEFMKRLSHSVNIIPVIAKADTMTIEERQEFKQRVRKELEMGGIEFYPQKEFDEDMEDKSDNDKIREAMPFAVVGSDKEYQVNGKRVLGRKTPWGIVEVENPNHCEFAQLRDFLIRSHLQDLKEVTHNIHYETYRAKRLNENGGLHPISSNDTQESNL